MEGSSVCNMLAMNIDDINMIPGQGIKVVPEMIVLRKQK